MSIRCLGACLVHNEILGLIGGECGKRKERPKVQTNCLVRDINTNISVLQKLVCYNIYQYITPKPVKFIIRF